jgi:hypothetical protein
VLFLLPHSASSLQLSSWLKANDPSIFSPLKTVQETRPPLASSIYEPGATALPLRSLPKQEKKESTDLLPPANEPALPSLLLQEKASMPAAATAPFEQKTVVKLLDPLSTRISGTLGAPSLPAEAILPLPPTKLRLNIDTEGTPHHVILLQSCGHLAADEAASRWAMSSHFAPADHESWGDMLIIWGMGSSTNKNRVDR